MINRGIVVYCLGGGRFNGLQIRNSQRNSRTFKFSFWMVRGIVRKIISMIFTDIVVRAAWGEERIYL